MTHPQQHEGVYAYIGQRIRERRKLLKLNQTALAELMGFSYQQMQKYETGASHVSAGKLLLFAKILNVPPGYFYDGIRLQESIGKRIESNVIQKNRARNLRLLLVEDNPADVLLFKKALGNYESQITLDIIHDAEKAMDYLQNNDVAFDQQPPDLVILDLSLPKISGIDLLKSIKKNSKTMQFPVIVLTNSINTKDMMGTYRNGAAGFIQKSVDLEEYMESIETVIKYWSKTVVLPAA